MAVMMNKSKWNSLPDNIKTIMEENTGLSLSTWCGESYDNLDGPSKKQVMEKGIEIIQLPEADKEKLRRQTLVQRNNWVKTMESKGRPGQKVLDAALKYLNE